MRISIKNFKGVKRADFEIPKNGLVTITGDTGFGKTSICEAVRCATVSDWRLYPNMTKEVGQQALNRLARSKSLENSEHLESECIIIDEELDVSVSWSEYSVSGEGHKGDPQVAPYIVGYHNICKAPVVTKSLILGKVFELNPTRNELLKELPTVPEPVVSSVWKDIEKIGWDGAHTALSSQGTALKRRYQDVTGGKYGIKKAETYLPDGWTHEMKDTTEKSLLEELNEAKQWYEQCLKSQGVSEDKIEELEEKAIELGDLKEEFSRLSDDKIASSKKVMDLTKKLGELPNLKDKSELSCPKCNAGLMLRKSVLVEFKEPTKKEIQLIESLNKQLDVALSDSRSIDEKISLNRSKITIAEEAKAKLDTVKVSEKGSEERTENAKLAVDTCEKRIRAYKLKKEADSIHEEISQLLVIVTQLANDGLRKKVLKSKIGKFNDLLLKISPNINVRMNEELEFFINGTPYYFASNGQKQYLQGVIQMAMAHITKFPLAVIDCDKMDDRHYGELTGIGQRAKFHVLIAGFGIPNPDYVLKNDLNGQSGVLEGVK